MSADDPAYPPDELAERRAEREAESFFGITRPKGEPRLTGVIIEGGRPLTPEIIEEAARLMWEASTRPPCGVKERPHIIPPHGGYCVECGYGPLLPTT